MTYSSDRLDRIEALLATVAESNAASTQRLDRIEAGLDRTQQITDSNARAIEAWSSRIEEGIAEAAAVSTFMAANTNRRMEEAITDTVQMISDLSRQQQETDQRFEFWLQDSRADRQRGQSSVIANGRSASIRPCRPMRQSTGHLPKTFRCCWLRLPVCGSG